MEVSGNVLHVLHVPGVYFSHWVPRSVLDLDRPERSSRLEVVRLRNVMVVNKVPVDGSYGQLTPLLDLEVSLAYRAICGPSTVEVTRGETSKIRSKSSPPAHPTAPTSSSRSCEPTV